MVKKLKYPFKIIHDIILHIHNKIKENILQYGKKYDSNSLINEYDTSLRRKIKEYILQHKEFRNLEKSKYDDIVKYIVHNIFYDTNDINKTTLSFNNIDKSHYRQIYKKYHR